MPYLHCSDCGRTAWLRATTERDVDCRRCGGPLSPLLRGDDGLLAAAVRDRFARDSVLDGGRRPRFVRDSGPHRLAE